MHFYILTLFPEMVMGLVSHSILGRAKRAGKITVTPVDIRDFSENKHNRADDYPYGGGCGMVMAAPPIYRAYQSIPRPVRTLLLTPAGRRFDTAFAHELSKESAIAMICGHYEGIDLLGILSFPAAKYRQGLCLMRFRAFCPACWAMQIPPATRAFLPGCLSTRNIRGRQNIWGFLFLRCFFPETMLKLPNGGTKGLLLKQ
jgi:tRNA (guanine-N1)-methyltransferase